RGRAGWCGRGGRGGGGGGRGGVPPVATGSAVSDCRLERRAGAAGDPGPRAGRPDRGSGDRAARSRGRLLVTCDQRAGGHDRRQAGPEPPAGSPRGAGARRGVAGGALAADHGGRGAKRPGGCAYVVRSGDEGDSVTLAQDRTGFALERAVERATERLLELQHPEGWSVRELESNATMIAQHQFWHHFLGLRTPELDRKIANELLARQRADGTWSIWLEGPPDLSTTIEAYTALKLAGVDPGPLARDFIRGEGGASRARVLTRCFLALLGPWPWQGVARMPPEVILLPPDGPFSVYNFSCWARQTVVPLSVVQALRPVRQAPIDLREIGARAGQTKPPPRPG